MIDKLRTKSQYDDVMRLIDSYLAKATNQGGFHTLSEQENEELRSLSLLAEEYEDQTLKIFPLPTNIQLIVIQKIMEQGISQKQLAVILEMGETKLSKILKGRQEPDILFLKGIHQKLGIDGNLILELV